MAFLNFFRKADEEEKKRKAALTYPTSGPANGVYAGNYPNAGSLAQSVLRTAANVPSSRTPTYMERVMAQPAMQETVKEFSAIRQAIDAPSKAIEASQRKSTGAAVSANESASAPPLRSTLEMPKPRPPDMVGGGALRNALGSPGLAADRIRLDKMAEESDKRIALAKQGKLPREQKPQSIKEAMEKLPEETSRPMEDQGKIEEAAARSAELDEKTKIKSVGGREPGLVETITTAAPPEDKAATARIARELASNMREIEKTKRLLDAREKMERVVKAKFATVADKSSRARSAIATESEARVKAQAKLDDLTGKTAERAANAVKEMWAKNPNFEAVSKLASEMAKALSANGVMDAAKMDNFFKSAGLPFRLMPNGAVQGVTPEQVASRKVEAEQTNARAAMTTALANDKTADAKVAEVKNQIEQKPAQERELARMKAIADIYSAVASSEVPAEAATAADAAILKNGLATEDQMKKVRDDMRAIELIRGGRQVDPAVKQYLIDTYQVDL
jgi:hypothetical protein